jgi:hypothetical protein
MKETFLAKGFLGLLALQEIFSECERNREEN